MPKAPGLNTTKTKYYALGGGLDVSTPALSVDPGYALAMVNFEPWYNGGYRRVDGYERFDGRPLASSALFIGFTLNTTIGLVLGQVMIGDSSGATGILIGFDPISMVAAVTKVSGTFLNGETINAAQFTIIGDPGEFVVPPGDTTGSDSFYSTWLLAAQDEYRQDIQEVPGTGEVLGTWQRDENVYAIRDQNDSAGGAKIYLATDTGWDGNAITMASYLYYDTGGGGTAHDLPNEGDVITGASSSASATVHRVVEHGGATATNDSYGYFSLVGLSGHFTAGENLQIGGGTFAHAQAKDRAFTLAHGGNYQFLNQNFFGGASTYRTYVVSGVGPAFEIDENNIVTPILFPANDVPDQPDGNFPFLLEEHINYLFLAFPGGRFAHTVVGEPLMLNGFLGAEIFGVGGEITGMLSIVGGVLVVLSGLQAHGLYGTGVADWNLVLVAEKSGSKIYTSQKMDTVYSLNDLGISSLSRTQSFGNFAGSTLTQLIQPIITQLRQNWTTSTIVRRSNQYRVYFNDGSFLIMYVPAVGQQNRAYGTAPNAQFGYAQYPAVVKRIYDTEDAEGAEITYFASTDGFVYKDQSGTSYDGAEISSYLRLAFNHVGSPAYRKHFRRADLETNAEQPIALQFIQDLSYGSQESDSDVSNITAVDIPEIDIFGGGGFWNVSNWENFFWDGQNIATARADLDGTGENIGFLIYHKSGTDKPFVLQGLTIHYDLRRLQR